jgi:aldose 1-epimerase
MEHTMTERDDAARGVPAEVWLQQDGAMAAFTPSEGFCCTALRVRRGEEWVSALAEPPSWEALHARPAFYGNPILFPYAFGVSNGILHYGGRSYPLRPGRARRVVHGFARDHAWQVEETGEGAGGAYVRASIVAGGEGDVSQELLAEFPFPCRLTATYSLSGSSLLLSFEACNLGAETMPLGVGIHPYLPLPLLPGTEMGEHLLCANAPLVGSAGEQMSLAPASGALDLGQGQPLDAYLAASPSGGHLLRLHAMPPGEGRQMCWALRDTRHNLSVVVEASADFGFVLNYLPPAREVLSPVVSTCAPDAFNLAASGHTHTGMINLAPGEIWRGWTRITVVNGAASLQRDCAL